MALCGLSPSRRFTFYDQIHTVGIDIPQAASAVAAVTLGKDMTLRDYAQVSLSLHVDPSDSLYHYLTI